MQITLFILSRGLCETKTAYLADAGDRALMEPCRGPLMLGKIRYTLKKRERRLQAQGVASLWPGVWEGLLEDERKGGGTKPRKRIT